jgi:hypothetical protein
VVEDGDKTGKGHGSTFQIFVVYCRRGRRR